MKRCFFFLFLGFYSLLLADQDLPPLSTVEAQVKQAQKDFEIAKKLFNPWYAGPLLTGSAHVIPLGMFNLQPYLFAIVNYAAFDKERKSRNTPNQITINPFVIFQFGVLPQVDLTLGFQGLYNKTQSVSSGGYGDMPVQLGIGLVNEGPYIPAVKIYFSETFPTGKYQNANPNKKGQDITGAGAFLTTFTLNFSKVVWWVTLHPMNIRLSLNYDLYPSKVHVKGFNSYGGGFGTNGRVKPGRSFQANIGYEVSFSQKWVYATDISYVVKSKNTFVSGTPGTDGARTEAKVGGPSNDSLSLAPAIEYNPMPNLGILGGVWFTVYGRNTSNFISGIFTFTYLF